MMQLDLLNYVANRPEVREGIAPGEQILECSAFFSHTRNIMLGDELGVLLFFWQGDDIYEIHYLLTSALRGKAGLEFVKAALRFMFTEWGAVGIYGFTPRENRAARAMNRALGAWPVGEAKDSQGRTFIKYTVERAAYELPQGSIRHWVC